MYGALWRLLPGPWPVKALLSLILVVGVVAVCFLWLFPAIAPLMPFNDNSVQKRAAPEKILEAPRGMPATGMSEQDAARITDRLRIRGDVCRPLAAYAPDYARSGGRLPTIGGIRT